MASWMRAKGMRAARYSAKFPLRMFVWLAIFGPLLTAFMYLTGPSVRAGSIATVVASEGMGVVFMVRCMTVAVESASARKYYSGCAAKWLAEPAILRRKA